MTKIKFKYLITLSIILYIINNCTSLLFTYLSDYYKSIYTSLLTLLAIMLIIDGYSILNELDKVKYDNEITHKLLDVQLLENEKIFKHNNEIFK